MAHAKDLTGLSPGERWWVRRRRLGLTQERMAHSLSLSEKMYNLIERDRATFHLERSPRMKAKPGELCALARRRHGLDLWSTAAAFGISHTELLTREREHDPRLVSSWASLGYLFFPEK